MKSLMISASRPCRLSCLESSSLRRFYFSVEWIFPLHRSLPCRAFGPLSGLSEQAGHIGTSVNVQLCWGMTVDTLSHWASDSESMVHAKTPHPLNELTYNLRGAVNLNSKSPYAKNCRFAASVPMLITIDLIASPTNGLAPSGIRVSPAAAGIV